MKDGFSNCLNAKDEIHQTEMDIQQSCSRVRRHRFRCSPSQATCLSVMAWEMGDQIVRIDSMSSGSVRRENCLKSIVIISEKMNVFVFVNPSNNLAI